MEMEPVVSSQIAAVGFENGTLRVEFKSGSQYDYSGVPESVFLALKSADSVGRYFGANVKGSYPYQKVQ